MTVSVVFGAKRLEDFVRRVAEVELDKSDVERLSSLVSDKLHDMLIVGVRHAGYNNRDLIMAADLPITKGLQESMQDFQLYEDALEVQPILDQLATYPLLDREPSQEVIDMLSDLYGTLMMVTAQLMTVVDPGVENPRTETWDRVERTMDLLV